MLEEEFGPRLIVVLSEDLGDTFLDMFSKLLPPSRAPRRFRQLSLDLRPYQPIISLNPVS
jgi:hypothetical protein